MSPIYKGDSSDKAGFLRELEARQHLHDFPPQIIIETTAACNLTCAHCGHDAMTRPVGHMSMALYRQVIDEIAEHAPHTEVWPTFYGEAFLLGYRLFYMLQYAKRRGLTNLVLNTNGTRFTAEVAEWVIESGLDLVMFSLDGFSPAVFESIRVGAHRDEVFANVERLLAIKARRGATTPRVEVQYSMMDTNEHEVDQFREYWLARGADVKIREKMSWGGAVDAANLDPHMHRIACPWARAPSIGMVTWWPAQWTTTGASLRVISAPAAFARSGMADIASCSNSTWITISRRCLSRAMTASTGRSPAARSTTGLGARNGDGLVERAGGRGRGVG